MKFLTLLLIAAVGLSSTSCLSTAQKAQAKTLLVQAGTQLSKDLAANVANTGAQLIQSQIVVLNAKLDAQLAALGENPDPVQVAKINALKASLKTGATLTADLQQTLQKVLAIDAIPAPPPADTPATSPPAS